MWACRSTGSANCGCLEVLRRACSSLYFLFHYALVIKGAVISFRQFLSTIPVRASGYSSVNGVSHGRFAPPSCLLFWFPRSLVAASYCSQAWLQHGNMARLGSLRRPTSGNHPVVGTAFPPRGGLLSCEVGSTLACSLFVIWFLVSPLYASVPVFSFRARLFPPKLPRSFPRCWFLVGSCSAWMLGGLWFVSLWSWVWLLGRFGFALVCGRCSPIGCCPVPHALVVALFGAACPSGS